MVDSFSREVRVRHRGFRPRDKSAVSALASGPSGLPVLLQSIARPLRLISQHPEVRF